MALMQIAEPGVTATVPARRKVGLGIDLGTTNSLVARFDGRELTVFADAQGRVTLPSVVYYGENEIDVGHSALAQIDQRYETTVASAKRFMGRSRDEVSDDGHLIFADEGLAFATQAGAKTPVEVSADILRALRARAQDHLGDEEVAGVVVTVPAYFDDAQRQATRQAAELAGLKVLRLLNEPTAAAVAYGLDSDEDGVIAVYDLGGGTFDISILRLHRGVFEVLATGGDSALGGDDFDRRLADHLLQHIGLENPTPAQRRRILTVARAVKEQLTDDNEATVDLSGLVSGSHPVHVDRQTFNGLCSDLINRTLDACRQCVIDAEIDRVDRVVLVGGSTRMPVISDIVAQLFGCEPLCSIDPDQVVAMGAARQADTLVGNRDGDELLLLDVTPLSLGVETYGGLVERIVPRNTTIPVVRAQEFTTARDGQTGLEVHVVQGERERVEDCRSLARFELKGIPPMVAGAARILVTFQVDADGLLEVSAREETTGHAASITVKPSFGLEDDEVADMLRASFEFAAEDMQARQLTEARVDAAQLIEAVEAAMNADGDLLEPSEAAALTAALEDLRVVVSSDDPDTIRSATETTGKATEVFAARRMDRSIQQALGGVSLTALDKEFES